MSWTILAATAASRHSHVSCLAVRASRKSVVLEAGGRCRAFGCRWLSSSNSPPAVSSSSSSSSSDEEKKASGNGQPFAQVKLKPMMWDPLLYRNPTSRPRYNGRTKILQMEDFRRRPKVSGSATFDSLEDARVTLTWMTHKQQAQIFTQYKEFLMAGWHKYGVTSHEYVIRVLAQKFQYMPERIAGIIGLQWREAKYRLDGSEEVLDDVAEYMDNCYLTEIRQCYKAYGMRPPADLSFVESVPCEIGTIRTKMKVSIDDVIDFDEEWRKFEQDYLEKKANKILSEYQFLEDVDEDKVMTKIDEETLTYLKRKQKYMRQAKAVESKDTPESIREDNVPVNGDGSGKRPRWKYVAQIVNTQKLKDAKKKARERPILGWRETRERQRMPTTYSNNCTDNTLVEQSGSIRQATMADAKQVPWKPKRITSAPYDRTMKEVNEVLEFIIQDTKRDWLDYINGRPHTGVFAMDQNAINHPDKKKTKDVDNSNSSLGGDDDDSSSSSSDEGEDDTLEEEDEDEADEDEADEEDGKQEEEEDGDKKGDKEENNVDDEKPPQT